MRIFTRTLAVGLALCWAVPVFAQVPKGQKVKSPAELLPANTLAYAEVQKPGQFAKEIRELFKDSVLYNLPESFSALEAKHPDQPEWATM
jgi:hypothetical protein